MYGSEVVLIFKKNKQCHKSYSKSMKCTQWVQNILNEHEIYSRSGGNAYSRKDHKPLDMIPTPTPTPTPTPIDKS